MFMGVLYNDIGCYVVGGRRGCVGRGCAGVGGYGRGVGVVVVVVFSAPLAYLHSYLRWISERKLVRLSLHSASGFAATSSYIERYRVCVEDWTLV